MWEKVSVIIGCLVALSDFCIDDFIDVICWHSRGVVPFLLRVVWYEIDWQAVGGL